MDTCWMFWDIMVNLIFHLQTRYYFTAVVVQLRTLFATALQSNRIMKLRMSHQKFNFTFDFPFFSFAKDNLNNTNQLRTKTKELSKEQLQYNRNE